MANRKLEQALQELKDWQRREDHAGKNRHGRCLEAVRYALVQVGLRVPPVQNRPDNTALWNGKKMLEDPDRYHWKVVDPSADRYTLEYFDHVGKLPDGRIAGHIGIVDHQARIIFSSTDYPLTKNWQDLRLQDSADKKRLAVFLPIDRDVDVRTDTQFGNKNFEEADSFIAGEETEPEKVTD